MTAARFMLTMAQNWYRPGEQKREGRRDQRCIERLEPGRGGGRTLPGAAPSRMLSPPAASARAISEPLATMATGPLSWSATPAKFVTIDLRPPRTMPVMRLNSDVDMASLRRGGRGGRGRAV